MNRQSELLKNIDWVSIFMYTLLVFMGWLNIYAAVYNDSHSSIFDITQKYGKQLIWIGASFVLGFIIMLTDSKFFTAFSFIIYGLTIGLLAAVLVFGKKSMGRGRGLKLAASVYNQPNLQNLPPVLPWRMS